MIIEKVGEWLTWGKITFAIIVGAAGFGTFVAGEIAGASSLEPRVAVLELRATAIETKMSQQGEVLSEIRGYVKGIGAKLGVKAGDYE
jgi:hypothetical protein